MIEPTSEELMTRVRDHADAAAFDELYERHEA